MKKVILTSFLAASALTLSATMVGATSLDLTTAGADGYVNGGYFIQVPPQSTGTGVIDPFLRVQHNGTESGFNNSVDEFTLDDVAKGGQTWNHDLTLGDVPVVNVGGVDYYQFLLDINQNKGSDHELLSLNELEIWLKDGAITSLAHDPGVYSDLTGSGATKAWDLDSGPDGDSVIELNYELNPGSGAGDMFAYIPVTSLGTDLTKNLYLYCQFGTPHASNDGFEEWAVMGPSNPVPEPATMLLLGTGLVGLAGVGRMRRKKSA